MKFLVYGRENCVHCTRAKEFLDNEAILYEYVDITDWPTEDVKELASEWNVTTVPIVLSRDEFTYRYSLLGGADDLIKYVSEMSDEF